MSHRNATLSLYCSFSTEFRVADLLAFRAEALGLKSEFGFKATGRLLSPFTGPDPKP